MFTSLFSGNWKFETLLVRRTKSYFLFVLSCRNVSQFRGILVSGRIFDTICPVCIPDNVHPFTWLEMIQNEWDEDVFSIAIKSGNSCGWKNMNNSCSIKDLAVIKRRWIRLFCTSRLNTRQLQEVWPLSESQLSKLGQRWWVGLVFVHKNSSWSPLRCCVAMYSRLKKSCNRFSEHLLAVLTLFYDARDFANNLKVTSGPNFKSSNCSTFCRKALYTCSQSLWGLSTGHFKGSPLRLPQIMHELQSIASRQLNLDTDIISTCLTKIHLFSEIGFM